MEYFCLDIGGTFVKYGALDENGDILYKSSYETPKNGYSDFLKKIEETYNELEKNFCDIKGIALAVPTVINSNSGIIKSPGSLPFLYGKNIKDDLKNLFGLPVSVENDGNCSALCELWKGAAVGKKDVALVVCGTGIGGAIIKDGKIHHGNSLHGGEFGYGIHQFVMDERKFLTWSEIGSTGSLIKSVASRKNVDSISINGIEIFNLFENGDKIAIEEVDKFLFNFAIGIHNIQYYYDPEVILIGGGISRKKNLINYINKRLDIIYNEIAIAKIRPNMEVCIYFNDANMIGALYNFLIDSNDLYGGSNYEK